MVRVSLILIIFLALTPAIALHRDYCSFCLDKGGTLCYNNEVDLDNDYDQSYLYSYSTCADHFYENYEDIEEKYKHLLTIEDCRNVYRHIQNIDNRLFCLIPSFQIHGYCLEPSEFCCYSDAKSSLYNNIACGKGAIYPGYLDVDFYRYDSFLDEQLKYYDKHPSCLCYWPEYSKQSGEINDIAYKLFEDLFQTTGLSQLIDDHDEQWELLGNYIWNLNTHGLCVSCVCRSFWFSHYFRVCLCLHEYTKCNITHAKHRIISEKMDVLLSTLATEYQKLYVECLEEHHSTDIE